MSAVTVGNTSAGQPLALLHVRPCRTRRREDCPRHRRRTGHRPHGTLGSPPLDQLSSATLRALAPLEQFPTPLLAPRRAAQTLTIAWQNRIVSSQIAAGLVKNGAKVYICSRDRCASSGFPRTGCPRLSRHSPTDASHFSQRGVREGGGGALRRGARELSRSPRRPQHAGGMRGGCQAALRARAKAARCAQLHASGLLICASRFLCCPAPDKAMTDMLRCLLPSACLRSPGEQQRHELGRTARNALSQGMGQGAAAAFSKAAPAAAKRPPSGALTRHPPFCFCRSQVMDLNVKGIFFLTKALLPLLDKAATADDPARVINVGSIAGIRPQASVRLTPVSGATPCLSYGMCLPTE